MYNRNKMKFFCMGIIALSLYLTTSSANAQYRRLPAMQHCTQTIYWEPSDIVGPADLLRGMEMTAVTSTTWRYMPCTIPSDTYLLHGDISLVNVHAYVASGSIRVSACVHNPVTNEGLCDTAIDTSGTGEKWITITGTNLDLWSTYNNWNPYIAVRTREQGNIVRALWVEK